MLFIVNNNGYGLLTLETKVKVKKGHTSWYKILVRTFPKKPSIDLILCNIKMPATVDI